MIPMRATQLALTLMAATALASPIVGQEPTPAVETAATDQPVRFAQPRAWRAEDTLVQPARYTVRVAEFPSVALAEGVANALRALDWNPVWIHHAPRSVGVHVGVVADSAEARFLADELAEQGVVDGVVVETPRGADVAELAFGGPLLPAFTPGVASVEKLVEGDKLAAQLDDLARTPPPLVPDTWDEDLAIIRAADEPAPRGSAALRVVEYLAEQRREADVALALACRVARGEWTATPAERLRAGDIAADLLYGHARDWRAAWAASTALLANPDRDAAGRTRDQLRLAALAIELAATDATPRPSWNAVRARARRAFETAPERDGDRLRIKAELLYLQTFALEGRWDRVEEIATEFLGRAQDYPWECALARLQLARALERHGDVEKVTAQLDRVIMMRLDDKDAVTMGFDVPDLAERARLQRERVVSEDARRRPAMPTTPEVSGS